MSHHRARPTSTSSIGRARRRVAAAFAAVTVGLLVAGFTALASSPASAADARVGLGTAAKYAVLAGSTVTNTGTSVISGDLGLSPGSAVTGFPPGQVVNGSQHVGDAVALGAQNDLTIAYNDAASRPLAVDLTGQDLGGMSLTPGVYKASTSMFLTGTLTLDTQGDPAAVFIFQAGSTLTTAPNSRVVFLNGGSACNVYWQVGSSATLGTATDFVGTIMALTSASLQTTARVEGRVLARNGAVTLDTNVISVPSCSATNGGGDTASTGATGGGGGKPTAGTTPRGGGNPGGHGSDDKTGSTPTNATTTPVIPTGHPSTGAGVVTPGNARTAHASSSTALFVLAGLAAAAALAAGILGLGPGAYRRRRS